MFRRSILQFVLLMYASIFFGQPSATLGELAEINCPSPDTEVTLHSSAAPGLPILDVLHCGEQIVILGKQGDWYRVRTQSSKEGYVRETLVKLNPHVSSDDTSAVVKEIDPDTELKKPSRMPLMKNAAKPINPRDDYPISLRVLQTEQVPYEVQYGGQHVSTSCAINGTTNTNGSVISSGNVAFGSATAYSNLSMNCNTYQSPLAAWRHVLNAMLVVASDGNVYIMACDAAWRWSKCKGLLVGDTFRARMTAKGLAVEYLDNKGKSKEATYAILRSAVLGQ